MKPSEFKISISVESYEEKTAENYQNCNVVEKLIVSQLFKTSIPNFDSTHWSLEWILCQVLILYLFYFLRIKLSKTVKLRSGRAGSSFQMNWPDAWRSSLVLSSPNMGIQIDLDFFRFSLKVLPMYDFY